MRNVILAATLACVASFGLECASQVPADMAGHGSLVGQTGYDIGIVDEDETPVETCPKDKADTLVVYSATWCVPCQTMKPLWVTLRAQGYKVVYIDVDDPHKYDGKWEYQTKDFVNFVDSVPVRAVPTVRFYNSDMQAWLALNGKPYEIVGLTSGTKVKTYLWKPSSSTGLLPELLR